MAAEARATPTITTGVQSKAGFGLALPGFFTASGGRLTGAGVGLDGEWCEVLACGSSGANGEETTTCCAEDLRTPDGSVYRPDGAPSRPPEGGVSKSTAAFSPCLRIAPEIFE